LTEDPRLEAGARALCAFHGLNPDEPVLNDGAMVPMRTTHMREVRAVIEAADAVDRATPEMDRAGAAAIKAGAQDATRLAHKVWVAMAGLRSGQKQ
jgi:NAD(P)H-dependent FMN reductase